MNLKDLLILLHQVAKNEGTSAPFIVGGVPRDKVIGNLKERFNDIDLTNGDMTINHLAKIFSIKLHQYIPSVTKQSEDGHFSIFLKNLKIDFSSNFMVPNIDRILYEKGVKNISPLVKETYSRDFNVNTLLMSLDFRRVKDLTGEAIKDIKHKIIRTCLEPDLSFKYNTKRIIRVIYLAAKLDFDVDPKIIEWIKNNQHYNLQVSHEYLAKNINNALKHDADKTIYLLNKTDLWKTVPMTSQLYPYYKHKISSEMTSGFR